MTFSIERTIVITLFFIGVSQAASPRISNETYPSDYRSVDETFTGELFRLHVQDEDKGDILTAVCNNDNFNISTTASTSNDIWVYVYVNDPGLDRELLGDSVKVSILIADGQGNQITYRFTVYILDVNDNPPVFQNQPYNLEIPELPCNETTVVYNHISATDKDKNTNAIVSYSMEANAQSENTRTEYNDTFSINERTGEITQKKCLDYKNNSYYQFTVIAKDDGPNGGLNETVDFIIRVKDVQNSPPFFTGIPYRQDINETNPEGSDVLTVNARDGDTGVSNVVNYTITKCTCGGDLFEINADNGKITTKTSLDRDSGAIKSESGICYLDVLVREIEHGLKQWGNTTASTTVTIIINDLDDNKPAFDETKYIATVKENAPKDSQLKLNKSITVHDNDQGNNAHMGITIKDMNNLPYTYFVASPPTIQGKGNVSILVNNSTLLDYETLKSKTLHIKVVATETEDEQNYSEAVVDINVLDTNDNYPVFNATKFIIDYPENAQNNTVIAKITAHDADTCPKFKNITYSVSGGSGRFSVDKDTGTIRTYCTDCSMELDREKRSDFYLTLFATDKGGNRNSTDVIINLTDENDNAPQFLRQTYTVFLKENAKNLDVVTVHATDRDQQNTSNSEFTFEIISSTDEGLKNNLTLNETSGEIKLNTTLDYESLTNPNGTVKITVEVKDKGTPTLNSTCVVEISIQDVNDNTPTFNQSKYFGKVAEDQSSNASFTTNVTRVYATDKDVTPQNKDLSYFKTAGSDKFTVDPSTGTISVTMNSVLDREAVSKYNLTIIAIDRGSTPLTGTTTVTITVIDVNDEKPKFNDKLEYKASVKENATPGNNMIVKTCNASDEDMDSLLVYTITEVKAQDENGRPVNESLVKDYFGIHPNNGSVFVNDTLDRETAETVILKIQVTDENAVHNKPQNDSAYLTITLTDINDNPPTFEKTNYSIDVSEDAVNGRKYDGPRASDRDVNRTITYKLTDSNFKIDSKTGTIVKNGTLDRETNNSLSLEVFAIDNGVPPLNSSVIVHVRVLDANDNPPVFSNESLKLGKVHIHENTEVGEVIININATDKDEGPNNNNISYFLELNDYFEINESNGVISVTKSPDREVISQIKLTVIAKDNPISVEHRNTQKTSSMTITVYFDDKNDNSPTFARNYTPTVEEDKPVGSLIVQVSATDIDQGNTNNSKISYYIEDITERQKNKFSIDELTGEIKINSSLVDCVGSYVIKVVAYDHGSPQKNGSTIVNVTVTDKNRHPPVIGNLLNGNEIKIYECAKKGTVIHNFNYTDGDFGVNAEATFNISKSLDNVSGVFNITEVGNLTVVGKLDVNAKSSYRFGITATDHGTPALTSHMVEIIVYIIDVNDHLPSFKKDKVRFTMQENVVSDQSIGSVTAFDKDKDSESCYKVEGNLENLFNVTKEQRTGNMTTELQTGYIFGLGKLDYEQNQTIKFIVSVSDCSINKQLSGYCDKNSSNEIEKVKEETNTTIEVIIDVIDINDNPPVFKKNQYATGMRRNTEADAELELRLRNETYISDADSPQNGILSWVFSNYGNITVSPDLRDKIKENSGARPCDDGLNHLFCVTKNGTIINNKFFSEDLSGYFIVTVKVADNGGNDTADITIYLISDSQIVTMTIRDNKGNVAEFKDDLLQSLSSILGHTAVFDSLQDHKENGEINTQSSDLSFHIVDKDTKAVLSGDDAIELFDKHASNGQMIALQNRYNVITVAKQTMAENADKTSSEKLTFILVAISASEALIIAAIIFIAVSARTKFRRKLKAAVITTPDMEMHALDQKEAAIPGSNMFSKQNNPLYNTDVLKNEQDNNYYNVDTNSISNASDVDLDENDVGDPSTVYDKIEEKEVKLDMFTDDTGLNVSSEDLLDAALLHHAMRKSNENLDTLDNTDESIHSTDNPAYFINDAFTEELESTEI